MSSIGNLLNPEYYQQDNSNVKSGLSAITELLNQKQQDKQRFDLENQQIQQNNLRALAEAAAFNERQTKLGELVDNSMNQDKSIYSKASTLADNPSGYGVKIIKPKPAPPTAMMQLASGAFGDVMGNEIPNTQPEVVSQPTPTVVKGGRTIPRQVAQMKVGGKGQMSYSIEDNPEFKDLQDIKMKVAEAGGDPMSITDANSGLVALGKLKSKAIPPTNLDSEQVIQARALSRKLFGVRGAESGLPAIYKEMEAGKNIDQIEDTIRMSGQSGEMVNDYRNAAQSILINSPEATSQKALDYIDDFVSRGDTQGAQSQLKRLARVNAGVEESKAIGGKERTIKLLDEIQGDLSTLEASGINTNIFSGTAEAIAAKVGAVKEPELRKVATKILASIQNYRKSITGAAFNALESGEYKAMFPSIERTSNFNTANIDALKQVFSGDLDSFYALAMGEEQYQRLFKGGEQSGGSVPSVGQKFNGGTVISVERID